MKDKIVAFLKEDVQKLKNSLTTGKYAIGDAPEIYDVSEKTMNHLPALIIAIEKYIELIEKMEV